jgi:hypothetical protein
MRVHACKGEGKRKKYRGGERRGRGREGERNKCKFEYVFKKLTFLVLFSSIF